MATATVLHPLQARLLDLQRTAGNRAVAQLLAPEPTVQRLKAISDVVPPGRRVTPRQALTEYVSDLISMALTYEAESWVVKGLVGVRVGLAGEGS